MSSSGQYLRIETTGRKTGKKHQVLVRYIEDAERIVAFPQNTGKQDWVKNIAANPEIKVYYNDNISSAAAAIKQISDLNDPLLLIFTHKYGKNTMERWYKGQHLFVEITVKKELGSVSYDEIIYGDLEAAFDSVAADYDHHIFENPVNHWMRTVSIGTMVELFKAGQTVLEVGCGTGTETIALASRGVQVVACDLSRRMLEILSKKAKARGLSDMIHVIRCRPSDLMEQVQKLGYNRIEGAYSTYGAVNTEPNLHRMFQNIHSLMVPNSPLVLGVWNKYCLYEIVGYMLRMNPSLAFARLRNPVPVGKSKYSVASNAYSVRSLQFFLHPFFRLERVIAVPLFLPPSNLSRYVQRGSGLDLLKKIDLDMGSVFPLNRMGDHFLAIYTSVP